MSYIHPYIYIPDLPRDGEVSITGENYNHLARSMRIRVGDKFTLFNGIGLMATAVVNSISKSEIHARVIESSMVDNTPRVRLTLAFGILPPTPMKTLLAGATQLGVHALRPFMSEYNDIRINPNESMRIVNRWKKILIENSAIAHRSHIPDIFSPVNLKECVVDSEKYDFRFTFWEEGGRPWRDLMPVSEGKVFAVVGPKGGLSEKEISMLKEQNFEIISFGELILKAEIAAITACARIIGG